VRAEPFGKLEPQGLHGLPVGRLRSAGERGLQPFGERLRHRADRFVLLEEQRDQVALTRLLQTRKEVAFLKLEMARDFHLQRADQCARERLPARVAGRGRKRAGPAREDALDPRQQIEGRDVLLVQPAVGLTHELHGAASRSEGCKVRPGRLYSSRLFRHNQYIRYIF